MSTTFKMKKAPSSIATAVYKEVSNRRTLYQERDNVAHNLRRYRLMRHKVQVPKAYQRQLGGDKAIKMPITYRLVQTAVNAVAKGFPTVYVESLDAQDQDAADAVARGTNLLLQSIDNLSHVPFLYGLYFNTFGDGLGILKTQRGPWSGFPLPVDDGSEAPEAYLARVSQYLTEFPLPFTMRVVDPLTFYPPLDEHGRGVHIESGWRNRGEVMRSLRLAFDPKGRNSYQQVPEDRPYPDLEFPPGMTSLCRVDEVWADDEVAICIDGSSDVYIFENPEGEHPYDYGFAEPTGVLDPTNVGMSVVYPLYYLAPWIDTMTAVMTAWSLFAAPTPFTTQDPDPRVRPTTEQKVEMFQQGMMYHFPTGRKPGVLTPPPVGENVLGFLNFLIEAADRGGLPALVSGSGVGTRLPALTFQAAFEAATDRLRPAVSSVEKILAGALRRAHRIIATSGVPVRVNGADYSADPDGHLRTWAMLDPKELAKGRPLSVSLAIDSTQDLIAKGTHAQFMLNAQLWDMAQAMRFGGVKDVTKTKAGIAADTAWRMALPILAQAMLAQDPDFQQLQQQQMALQAAGAEPAAEEPQSFDEGGIVDLTAIMDYDGSPVDIGGDGNDVPGAPPGPGRNRGTVPAGRGGGRRAAPTQKPRGARNSPYGRA